MKSGTLHRSANPNNPHRTLSLPQHASCLPLSCAPVFNDVSSPQADTSNQLSSLIKGGWPLDSYIFDMQWHRTPNWGGYEWDDLRYANVTSMLAGMHDMGLYTGMNLHDVARPPFPYSNLSISTGVVAADNPNSWPAFAAAMGVDPAVESVDFDIGNRTYAVSLHELLVTPLLQQGLDMCWCRAPGHPSPLHLIIHASRLYA